MAGSAPSPASARVLRSRTRWPTPGRLRRCAARRTRCLTSPPTVPGGCCCPPPLRRACGAAHAPTHDFGFGLCLVTAWAEPDGLTRAEPLELCDESVARTVPSQYNPERRETSNKEIQPLLRHVHGCISRSRSRIPGVSSASVRINKCYVASVSDYG